MKAKVFILLPIFAVSLTLPAAGLTAQAKDGSTDEFFWLLDDTQESATPELLPPVGAGGYNARSSKAYMQMRMDSEAMIEVMRKTVALTKKRIEVARESESLICISCLENKIPLIEQQIQTASSWNTILANPENQAVDHLQAYWAIEDSYKKVKTMRTKMDQAWKWQMTLE